MGLVNQMLVGARRYAAGVDIAARAVTLVVLSRPILGARPLRIDWLASAPLQIGATADGGVVDRTAVVEALRGVFAQVPRHCAGASMRCAMAVPTSATLVATVPLSQLAPAGCVDHDASQIYADLEPLVLAEAERVAGVERHELAVDWRVSPADGAAAAPRGGGAQVTIAATARAHLEARIECAAMAGITVRAVEDEAHAALRAMRHAASYELASDEPYVALWIGAEGMHGWTVEDDAVVRDVHFPAPEYADLVDALRELVRSRTAGCAVVSGDIDMLRGVHFTLADIGDVLGCPVLPFECAALADRDCPLPVDLASDPSCAVAFGLALRGVGE